MLVPPNKGSTSSETRVGDAPKKRSQIIVACNECRRRKVKVPLFHFQPRYDMKC